VTPRQVTMGRVVIYRLAEPSAARSGNAFADALAIYPAIVTRVCSAADQSVDLYVFGPKGSERHFHDVPHAPDDEPIAGHWNWPAII